MRENKVDKVKSQRCWLLRFLAIGVTLCIFQSQSYALDVTLQWDSNPEPGIVKYKVYYKTGISGNRVLNNYEGTIGAVEGRSPVDVLPAADENPDPDVVEFTLHGLPSFLAYYFVVTAFDNKNLESDASNEVATNDSDSDGMADDWEIFWFGDIGSRDGSEDADGDGVPDGQEMSVYHTDPLNPDTDSDGLTDGQEVLLGRDPALKEVVFGSDSAKITNPFLPLSADLKMKYAGTGTMAGYGRYDLVLRTEVVDSVECLKVVERGNGNNRNPDLDPEWYDLWLAQDTSGVVWLLQEYSALEDSYRVLGKADAVVWLPANPVLGQRFAQEGPSYREVVETGVTVAQLSTGLGPYNGCLTVRWTNGSDDTFGHLAPGVGIVKEEWSGGETTNGWELQEITKAVTGSDELVANYGVTGLWHYDQVRGWTQLNTVNPDQMLAADIDNDGAEELVASFNGYGLYVYKESNGWSQINSVVPDAMMRLGNGLAVNFGVTYGLWRYDQVRGWTQLNTVNPDQMLATDIDNDGAEELVASFNGHGLCVYKEANGWSQLSTVQPDAMMRLGSGLVVNYGVIYGLWRYDQVRGWTQLDTVNPDQMLAVDMDNDGMEEVVASLSGYGLYLYKETIGWILLNSVIPEAIIGANLIN